MLSAARLLRRRASAQRWVLSAAALTILLATVLLCALRMYGESAATSGIRKDLSSAPADTVVTTVSVATSTATLDTQQRAIADAVRRTLTAVPSHTYASATSTSYGLTGHPGGQAAPGQPGQPELATFHFFTDLERHATLVAGRWPAPGGGAVQAAVTERTARALGVGLGARLHLTQRITKAPVDVVVSGVFRADPSASGYWGLDPYGGQGVRRAGYTTYGPFTVARETFRARFATDAQASWVVAPDFSALHSAQVARLAEQNRRLVATLLRGSAAGGSPTASSLLPDRLDAIDRALIASRSVLLTPILQLALLAAYALLLTARLLEEQRRSEHALMRARGASRRQLSALAAGESALLTLPAAVLAPPLASLLLGAVSGSATFTAAGLRLERTPHASTWAQAVAVAVGAGLVLALPLMRHGETFVASHTARGRPSRRSPLQRAGVDVALLVIAVLGYVELRHYSSPVLTTSGRLRVDPLLVVAPTLALLAGALLARRLLPLASHAVERLAARSRSLAATLGTWQVSRRPLRQSGPMLLLALALAIGTVSATYSVSWSRSQDDQATFRTGADLRVTSPDAAGAVPPLGRHTVYAGLPGVRALTPLSRQTSLVGEPARDTTVLGVDAAHAGEVIRLRSDLASRPLATMLPALRARRPAVTALPLPGDAVGVSVQAQFTSSASPSFTGNPSLSAVVIDGDGLISRLELGDLPVDGRPHTLSATLVGSTAGLRWRPSAPLRLLGLGVDYLEPPEPENLVLRILAVRAAGASAGTPGTLVRPRPGMRWFPAADTPTPLRDPPPSGTAGLRSFTTPAGALLEAHILASFHGNPSGSGLTHVELSTVAPSDPTSPTELPALADDALLRRTNGRVGGVVGAQLGQLRLRLRIVGSVHRWPTVAGDGGAALVDLPTLVLAGYVQQRELTGADEWWLHIGPGAGPADATAATARLAEPALAGARTDRDDLARALRDDPLGVGARGALLGGFVAAGLLAAIGFALHLGTAIRERRGEFGVLRALGAGRRELVTMVATEQAFLVGVGTLAGIVLGVLIAHLVVPLVTLSPEATRVVPPVAVVTPWRTVTGLAAAVVAGVALSMLALLVTVRRENLAGVLRLGEDS